MHAVDYDQVLAAAPTPARARGQTRRDPFAIFYTSGTTGLPKGAMVSHLNLEMNGYNQLVADASRPDDVNLVATPLYHMGAVFMAGHLHDARLHAGDPAAVHAGELACDTGTRSRIRVAADPDDDQRNPERT